MHVAFDGMDAASHVGPLGPGVGVGQGFGVGVGVGVGEGLDCFRMKMSAVIEPATVTVVSPISYPAFMARSVIRPAVSHVTAYRPLASLVVVFELSFTTTVAPETGVLVPRPLLSLRP